ncbi:hypothetical protein IWW54_002141 [Coemansia sp. RSA 2705]|nr:hypothetical protein IWW54_002141 [Coemansia sp. RSA 2705]
MSCHRETLVRRAVARRIIHQVRRRQVAKRRQLLGRRTLSLLPACDSVGWSADAAVYGSDSAPASAEPVAPASTATTAAAAAAITALAAAMSAARTDPSVDVDGALRVPQDAGSDAELALIQRIFELQQEKERLLRVMQQTS